MDKQKKKYEAPQLTVATFKVEQGYAVSSFGNAFRIDKAWVISASNPWSGIVSGGNDIGTGWTDNGGSAWE